MRKNLECRRRNGSPFLEGKGIRILKKLYHGEIDIIGIRAGDDSCCRSKDAHYGDYGTGKESALISSKRESAIHFNYYRMQRRLAENTAVRFDVIEVDKDFRVTGYRILNFKGEQKISWRETWICIRLMRIIQQL